MGYSRQNEKINRKWDIQKAKMDGLGKKFLNFIYRTRNLLHTEKVIKNVYLPLINSLLKKYPHLRFEGCFNSENEWQKGFDNYTFDHPVMQFVSYQLSLMNKGISKEEAFLRVTNFFLTNVQAEKVFYKNRIESEKKQRVSMAFGLDEEESLSYTAGSAYLAEVKGGSFRR
uniref:Uncharacterized protein n=1 Tax=Theileria parva TaxID=5875 RepID=Q4MZD8_THEPA|eukprot:XP_763613.1 hypothetical protein [Theileria parva strain Muguga]